MHKVQELQDFIFLKVTSVAFLFLKYKHILRTTFSQLLTNGSLTSS